MTDKEKLIERCKVIAEELSIKKLRDRRIYFNVIDTLFTYVEDNGICLNNGALKFSKKQVEDLFNILYHSRNYRNLMKCTSLNDIFEVLRNKKLYDGYYLNIPVQRPRKLIVDPARLRPDQLLSFQIIKNDLNSVPIRKYTSLQNASDNFFCEFIASAQIDGALLPDFHRRIIFSKFSEITFLPLTVTVPCNTSDIDDNSQNLAFFRYWISKSTEIRLLRLLIFLRKNHRTFSLHFENDYIFPKEWRTEKTISAIPNKFKNWSVGVLENTSNEDSKITLKTFRMLSLLDLLIQTPAFVVSALANAVPCDSLHPKYLDAFDKTLSKCQTISLSHENEANAKKISQIKRESNKILEEGKRLLLSNEQFNDVIKRLYGLLRYLPQKLNKNERHIVAGKIVDVVSTLPDKDSDTPQKFLKNLRYLGEWVALLIENPNYAIGSVRGYANDLKGKFLFMLGNNAIDEITTESLVDIIINTYTFYGSSKIREAISLFTNDLYDYQDNIFPEMAWERLPWGKDKKLNKENIRRSKSIITFQNIRDALEQVSSERSDKAKKLRICILLGFYGGCRILEIMNLRASNLQQDGGPTLLIVESKTKSGERYIPLSYIVPQEYLKEIVDFFWGAQKRGEQFDANYLFSDVNPLKESQQFSHIISKVFLKIGVDMRFHHLRHSFANWFITRWIAIDYGKDFFHDNPSFLSEDVFTDECLRNMSYLFYGHGQPQTGQQSFPHVMPVLARLLGHYGPITTMKNYVHILDWVYHLFASRKNTTHSIGFKSAVLQNFLQESYPQLPAYLRDRKIKKLELDTIASEQLIRLKSYL